MSPHLLDILEERIRALDADLLNPETAGSNRGPQITPGGREISAAEAHEWRTHAHVAELRMAVRLARMHPGIGGDTGFHGVPWWMLAGAPAGIVALVLWFGFQLAVGALFLWFHL